MRIPSSQIPQADVLDDVARVADAVKKGATTYQGIASFLGKVERQGRYYRLAAETIGLVTNQGNHAALTALGSQVARASGDQRIHILRSAVLAAPLFQRLIPFIERQSGGVSRQDLEHFIEKVTEEATGDTTIPRRTSTVVAWLLALGLVSESGGTLHLAPKAFAKVPSIEFGLTEPLVPSSPALTEYLEVPSRIGQAGPAIQVSIDLVKKERANTLHKQLQDLIASRIRAAGHIPRSNKLVDLAAFVDGRPIIFEVKSISLSNARSQVRAGLSQLYEYRYVQAAQDAALVLATSSPLPPSERWMADYLHTDRRILHIWDGNGRLYATPVVRKELAFLW